MDKITMIAHKVDDFLVEQRQSDGYINATALSKVHKMATGKRRDVSEWLENKQTKETINHLSLRTGIPVFELYQVFQGSPENGGGTWIHPQLAVRFGIWLSDEFGYLVEQWVEQWFVTGESSALHSKVVDLENKLEMALEAIASLQSQIQTLISPVADNIPPGWSHEIWESLPKEDKQHFWFLHRRRSFHPSDQNNEPQQFSSITTDQIEQKQHDEFQQVIGEILEEERNRVEAIKRELLREFWAEEGES